MLARYRISRGKPKPGERLPDGVRQDTRKHTSHCLRPTAAVVGAFLAGPMDAAAWRRFADAYRAVVEERFRVDRGPFDRLAELASEHDVYLGCSCPTQKQPRVDRCHTYLALQFMAQRYPELEVVLPTSG